jgi:adenosylcobinamide kinase/adenosylcobinamide-phosphate guanylyltransferase
MRSVKNLTLAGTGPASGFPVPGCPCAVCVRGERSGALRRPAELVRPGHWRLDVDGVVHPVDGAPQRLPVGQRRVIMGTAFRGLGGAVVLVGAGDPEPLLWAPQDGSLDGLELGGLELDGLELGAAILGPAAESDPADPLTPTPPSVGCAFGLARLRSVGLIGPQTLCSLIGLGHREPVPERLALGLAAWGAWAPNDGDDLDSRPLPPAGSGRTLVIGGSSSGKSALAEHLLAAAPEVLYVATGAVPGPSPEDLDWARRVRRHRERRPGWWRTVESPDVAGLLARAPEPLLIDSIGTWLTAVLDRIGAWDDEAGWRDRLAVESDALVRAWRARRSPAVAVSDEVGASVVPSSRAGRLFRDELGRLNARLADESDAVHLVAVGRLLT